MQSLNDDDAFFIQKSDDKRKKKSSPPADVNNKLAMPNGDVIVADDGADMPPTTIKRVPSICGYIEDGQGEIRTVLEEPDEAVFYLNDEDRVSSNQPTNNQELLPTAATAPANCTKNKHQPRDILRESVAIPDNLKDEICATLQERNISTDELLSKNDGEFDFLFPEPSVKKVMLDWRQFETWRRDQLPVEALCLVNAVKAGNLDSVKEITQKPSIPSIGKKLLIDHRDQESHCRTPLMHAARHGHLAVVGYLVKVQHADIYARDNHKMQSMAIHFAAQGGYVEIVRFLAGIDASLVEAKNKHGDTPLNMAAVYGKVKVVECLVNEKHANLENRGQYGMTPLLCAAEKGHTAVVKLLVEKGADVCAKDDKYNDMGIHWSARFGHLDTVTYFINAKPSLIEAINALGRTALHQAALGGHISVVKFLAKKGANLKAMSNDEDLVSNALHLAAYFGYEQVAGFLLDTNPDLLEIENKDGKTAYMLAKEEKRLEILRLLESRGASTVVNKKK